MTLVLISTELTGHVVLEIADEQQLEVPAIVARKIMSNVDLSGSDVSGRYVVLGEGHIFLGSHCFASCNGKVFIADYRSGGYWYDRDGSVII